MDNQRGRLGLGILLLLAGAVLLLQNLGVFGPFVENLIWLLLFGLAGLAFLLVFIFNRHHWWALIPGCTLLGLAALVGFGEQLGEAGGALFLAAIGLSFVLIFVVRREHWWAIIPGGSLFSVAAMILVASTAAAGAALGVMFLGMALTFLLIYLWPGQSDDRRWALIPAGILALLGILAMLALNELRVVNYLWPLALIIGGGYMLWRAWRARS